MKLGNDVRAVPSVINGKWEVVDRIGAGQFGDVYKAIDRITGDLVAVKVAKSDRNDCLRLESRVYEKLRSSSKAFGVSTVYFFGKSNATEDENDDVLVMDFLGSNLIQCMSKCRNRKLSLRAVLMIGMQLVRRLESLHDVGYIHRDVKPENIVMGRHDEGRAYLVDFGLAKNFRAAKNKGHISFKDNKGFVGTPRFASVNAHLGLEQSRRDDLEGLGYTLIYLYHGRCPWEPNDRDEHFHSREPAGGGKLTLPIRKLCAGMPYRVEMYFRYVRSLGFRERPDYAYLQNLFKTAMSNRKFVDDRKFDWM